MSTFLIVLKNLRLILILSLPLILCIGCMTTSSTGPDSDEAIDPTMPEIPAPTSATPIPAGSISEIIAVDTSDHLAVVSVDFTFAWQFIPLFQNVVEGPEAVHIPAAQSRVSMIHRRYWKCLQSRRIDPGTSYSLVETWHEGISRTEGYEFTKTIGISSGIGVDNFSSKLSVELSETFTTSTTVTEEYAVQETISVDAPNSGTRIFTLWQLVDEYELVDDNYQPLTEGYLIANSSEIQSTLAEYNEGSLNVLWSDAAFQAIIQSNSHTIVQSTKDF